MLSRNSERQNSEHRNSDTEPHNSFQIEACCYFFKRGDWHHWINSSVWNCWIYFKLVKTQPNYIYFWHYDLYRRPLSEEAGSSSSGSWHDLNMPCQESGRLHGWVYSCPHPSTQLNSTHNLVAGHYIRCLLFFHASTNWWLVLTCRCTTSLIHPPVPSSYDRGLW